MNELGNLNIVGKSSVSGGRYRKVKIMGQLSAADDFEALEIIAMGSMDSSNMISCDKIRVLGNVKSRKLKVKQSGTVLGKLTASDIAAEHFEVMGEVRCQNAFSCGELKVRGVIAVDGLLNTESLAIKSRERSRVKEMGGRRLEVAPSLPFAGTILEAQLIEFDEVDLEATQAELVRGRNVIVGENCQINVVEYTDNLIRHPNAQIDVVRKI